MGLNGPFHGGYTTPVGFGLNPRKYLFGLARAAHDLGVQLYQKSPVQRVQKTGPGFRLATPNGCVKADTVLICTNGYSSEDVPDWLSGRYLPAQSTVLVTRPLIEAEKMAQGWTSDQMCYDTRHLLHYFRLMPDGRFLFGMRGGLRSSDRAEAAIRHKVQRDFRRMFPAWAGVEITHIWSGMVCLSRGLVPYAGLVPGNPACSRALHFTATALQWAPIAGARLARIGSGAGRRTTRSRLTRASAAVSARAAGDAWFYAACLCGDGACGLVSSDQRSALNLQLQTLQRNPPAPFSIAPQAIGRHAPGEPACSTVDTVP